MKTEADNTEAGKAEADNTNRGLNNSSYPTRTEFNNCPRADGAKRRSGRKPEARVTNSAWLFTP